MERPKLLLADDSVTVQRVVNLTFADEGIDVVAVGDGDAALREIASAQPDIVLADVCMPGPNGYEICSLLRSIEETAKIPVILLVGSFEQFDAEQAERSGADAFVTKPFQSIRQLVEQVKELLQKRVDGLTGAAPVPSEGPSTVPPEVDTTDIDKLYEQSFGEAAEMPVEMAADGSTFVSDRLDDEIIETSYSADQPNEQFDHLNTKSDLYFNADSENNVAAEPQDGGELRREDHLMSYEETLQMDAPPVAIANSSSEHTVHNAPTEELHRDPFATTTDAFDLDDLDLLDLTNASDGDEEILCATPSEARQQGSNKQVVSLSPELMDIIVKKVVEKLSEKY